MIHQQRPNCTFYRTGAVAGDDADGDRAVRLLAQQKGVGLGDSLRYPQSVQVDDWLALTSGNH